MVKLTLTKIEPPEFAAKIEKVVGDKTVVAGDTVALKTPVLVENETFAPVSAAITPAEMV